MDGLGLLASYVDVGAQGNPTFITVVFLKWKEGRISIAPKIPPRIVDSSRKLLDDYNCDIIHLQEVFWGPSVCCKCFAGDIGENVETWKFRSW